MEPIAFQQQDNYSSHSVIQIFIDDQNGILKYQSCICNGEYVEKKAFGWKCLMLAFEWGPKCSKQYRYECFDKWVNNETCKNNAEEHGGKRRDNWVVMEESENWVNDSEYRCGTNKTRVLICSEEERSMVQKPDG